MANDVLGAPPGANPGARGTPRPVVLGIVGDSSSGKTTLCQGVVEILGAERVTVVCVDDYHRFDRGERAANGLSALDPSANYMDIMEQHLRLLRGGQPILKPVYSHETGTFGRPEYIAPREFVIAEGLLGYTSRASRDCYDVKVFLDPEEDLRVEWKVQRDVAKRGYSREGVLAQLAKRSHDSPAHIAPQRAFADIVTRFSRASEGLDVRHTLRPTLPHPDLSPLLDAETRHDLRLGLERDIDSKPVDVLDIAGEISDERTRRVEELLWQMMPDGHRVHVDVGEYFDGTKQETSNPLALSQLLVAFHIVKAGQGVRAL